MTKQSRIENCHVISKAGEEGSLFYAGTGDVAVNLNGYLICPIDMFTPRQVQRASEKYNKSHARNAISTVFTFDPDDIAVSQTEGEA